MIKIAKPMPVELAILAIFKLVGTRLLPLQPDDVPEAQVQDHTH